ncbi:N-acetylglucosamine-1-phosphodiester alpha-N-acetylglucosaminidase-like isoform X1 [Styela clava]
MLRKWCFIVQIISFLEITGMNARDKSPSLVDDVIFPYAQPRHGSLHRRHARSTMKNPGYNQTYETFTANVTDQLVPAANTRYFVSDVPSNEYYSYITVKAYGHITTVTNPLRSFSVLEPHSQGGCSNNITDTVENTSKQRKCRVAQNGGFFSIKYGSCLGNLVSDGRLVIDHGNIQNANFGITKNGTIVVGYITSEDIEKMDFKQLIGGAVWLVRNGSPYVEESFKCESADVQETGTLRTFIDVQSARTAIGHDALGRVVFVNTEGQTKVRGLNLNQFARLLIKEFHLVNAINLDGGGSATLVLNGSLASYPSDHCKSDPEWRCARAVTTIVCAHDPDCETECVHGECIHGKCSCSVNYRGESCEKLYCGHHNCSSHGSCQPEGCDCSPGWHGTDCTIPCGPTHFGKNCSQECRCRNNGTCNSVTGICTCRPGFGGALCEKGCEPGTYGSNCQYTCHCANTCTCDPASGVCRNDTSYNLEKYASINVAQCLIKKQQRKSEKIQKTKDFMEFHWMAIMCTTVGALVLSLAFNVYLLLLKSGCTGGYDHHDNHKKAKNVPLDSIPLDQEEDTEADANFIPLQGISLSNHQTTEADANKIALKGIRSSPKRKTKPFSMGNNRIKTKRKSKMPSLKNLVQTFKNKQSHSKEGYTPLNNPNNDESNLEFEETSLL